MDKESTTTEILEAINEFSNRTDERFDKMDERFDKMDERFDKMDSRFNKIESTMVTKDYLDDKLADLRGDLVVLIRKEDNKVVKLIDILKKRKVITEADEKTILSLEPFAKLYP